MKILTLGSNGQLGSEIKDLVFNYSQAEFIFKDLPELNICNYEALQNFISDHNISAVINCAAYVGGIQFGLTRQADIFHNNLLILSTLFGFLLKFINNAFNTLQYNFTLDSNAALKRNRNLGLLLPFIGGGEFPTEILLILVAVPLLLWKLLSLVV